MVFCYISLIAKYSAFNRTYFTLQSFSNTTGIKNDWKLKQAVNIWKELGYINDDFSVDRSKFYDITSDFTIITKEEVDKIKEVDIDLFKYYIYIIKSLNRNIVISLNGISKSKIIGMINSEYFCSELEISKSTLTRYNNKLTKHNILYIIHNKNGNKTNNIYSRYEDREYADEYVVQNNKKVEHSSASYNRSLSQKYNFLKKGKKYSKEEIEQIRKFCEDYNRYVDENPNCGITKKDMSVFNN